MINVFQSQCEIAIAYCPILSALYGIILGRILGGGWSGSPSALDANYQA